MKELKPKHLHIYERSKINKEVYRCLDPDCTHWIKREFLEGKRARCAKCKHQDFLIPASQLHVGHKIPGNKHLVCDLCTKSPRSVVAKLAKEVALEVLTELSFEEAMNQSLEEPEMIPYSLSIENIKKGNSENI